jgi:hypothetical protein
MASHRWRYFGVPAAVVFAILYGLPGAVASAGTLRESLMVLPDAMTGQLPEASPGQTTEAGSPLPDATAGQSITIEGRLELAGTNYFLDPKFVLVDDNNRRAYVTPWAPLEIPPSPPQGVQPAPGALNTMADYLGRRLSVTGVYRIAAQSAVPFATAGAKYIEVRSVTDLVTGTRIVAGTAAADADAQADTRAGSTAGPTAVQQATPHSINMPTGAQAGGRTSGPLPTQRAKASTRSSRYAAPHRAERTPEATAGPGTGPQPAPSPKPALHHDTAPKPTERPLPAGPAPGSAAPPANP